MRPLSFSSMDDRCYNIGDAHQNTCDWIFHTSQFEQWQDPSCLRSHNGETRGMEINISKTYPRVLSETTFQNRLSLPTSSTLEVEPDLTCCISYLNKTTFFSSPFFPDFSASEQSMDMNGSGNKKSLKISSSLKPRNARISPGFYW